MASDPRHLFSSWMLRIGALLILAAVVGCQKSVKIGQYQVPRGESAASAKPEQSATGPDRMVAAIAPHAGAAWFFKLSGSTDAVGKHSESFETLVKSVVFPESAEGQPQWTLPAGWTQASGGADLRFATITVSEKPPMEITVSTLPWSPERDLEELLSNLNRWRGQLTLRPLDSTDLADQIRWVKLADGEAILVDLHGTLKAGGMQPPIAAAGQPGEKSSLPVGHPPIDHPPTAKASPEIAQAGKDFEVAPSDQPELPFTYDVPKDWTAAKLPPFAVAAFTAKKDSQEAQITVSPLGRGAGGLLSNVNRWRAQINLPEISEDELKSAVKPYQVDGQPAQMVQLVGPEAASPRLAITVVMFDRGEATWFLRMRGDAKLVSDEQTNFEKFAGSVKFRDAGK